MNITLPTPEVDPRQLPLLDAAVGVFARYGFRKASMDEVARAAGVSRQGLYLQFANKEELFRRALEHSLAGQLKAAAEALADDTLPLDRRLVNAFDAWAGRFIEALGSDASDLMCAGSALAGSSLKRFEAEFESLLALSLGLLPTMPDYEAAGVSAGDLARVMQAAGRGFKHAASSREEFLKSMTTAARMMCAPRSSREP